MCVDVFKIKARWYCQKIAAEVCQFTRVAMARLNVLQPALQTGKSTSAVRETVVFRHNGDQIWDALNSLNTVVL